MRRPAPPRQNRGLPCTQPGPSCGRAQVSRQGGVAAAAAWLFPACSRRAIRMLPSRLTCPSLHSHAHVPSLCLCSIAPTHPLPCSLIRSPPDGALHHRHRPQRARRGKQGPKGGLALHGHALPEGVGVGAGVQGPHLQAERPGRPSGEPGCAERRRSPVPPVNKCSPSAPLWMHNHALCSGSCTSSWHSRAQWRCTRWAAAPGLRLPRRAAAAPPPPETRGGQGGARQIRALPQPSRWAGRQWRHKPGGNKGCRCCAHWVASSRQPGAASKPTSPASETQLPCRT